MRTAPYNPIRFLYFPFLIALTIGTLYFVYQNNPHLMAQEALYDELRLQRGSDNVHVRANIELLDSAFTPRSQAQQNLQRSSLYSESLRPTHRWSFFSEQTLAELNSTPDSQNSSVAIDEAGVYILSEDRFWVYSLQGSLLWSFAPVQGEKFAIGALSTTAQTTALATRTGSAYLFNKSNGQVLWYSKSNESYLRPPILGSQKVYFLSELKAGQLWKLLIADIKTGEVLKKISSLEEPIAGNLSFNELETMAYYNTEAGRLYGLNLEKAEAAWSVESEFSFESGPTVSGDRVYTVNAQGGLTAYDNRSARLIWTTALDTKAGGTVSILAEGFKIFILDKSGYIHALSSRTGKREWRFNTNQTGPIKAPLLLRMRGSSFADLKVNPHIRYWTVWSYCSGSRLCIFDPKEGQPYVRVELKDTAISEPYFDREGEDFWFVGAEKGKVKLYHYMEDKKMKALRQENETKEEKQEKL